MNKIAVCVGTGDADKGSSLRTCWSRRVGHVGQQVKRSFVHNMMLLTHVAAPAGCPWMPRKLRAAPYILRTFWWC